jgi:drug/metabolite transporter (DMT)-like permease
MSSLRYFFWFMGLGLFWGISPSLYKHLSDMHVPVTHTIFITGIGVGLCMLAISAVRHRKVQFDPAIIRYTAMCAFLMNIPFGLNLFLAAHVPPTELAIIITMSPFFNYAIALYSGWEDARLRKLVAIGFGFASTLVLIFSRDGALTGNLSWWLVVSVAVPLLYCAYNNYAARHWPASADTIQVGAWESFWSGILVVPLIFVVAPFAASDGPVLSSYWILGAAILMWIVERIAYFTLISEKGAVYTVQATYVSTPAAVVIAATFFGGASDHWLWVSLALLMVALYLNNSGAVHQEAAVATQPSS